MLASALISVVSLVLLVYWFRYTCLLLLQNREDRAFASSVASANRLSFMEVREQLHSVSAALPLEELHMALDRDYRVLRYLLEHSAGLDIPSIERQLLILDYHLMQLKYRLVKNSSAEQARKTLSEVSGILEYFAQKMGERAAEHIYA